MKNKALIVAFMMLFSASCIVQSPKYSTLEQVMTLHLGMSKKQVEETLGNKPYNIKAYTDTSISFMSLAESNDKSSKQSRFSFKINEETKKFKVTWCCHASHWLCTIPFV